tara:strand:- start:235 stop:708 length:474 start_codon:yes stop_codon:yes gene_type:complete
MTTTTTKCVYISEKKMNVILPENKSKSDFINDYDMWNGDLVALQSDGYNFPELDKKNNKIKSNNDFKKKLQEKKKNNKKEQKEKYNTGKYSRSSDPFYGKPLNERIKMQKQAKSMMKQEEMMKDNRMKEMMEHLSKMSESQQKEYINKVLQQQQEQM